MRVTATLLAPLLVAGAAAVAVAAAPTAAANPLTCSDVGFSTECLSAGKSQLTAVEPQAQMYPQSVALHRSHR